MEQSKLQALQDVARKIRIGIIEGTHAAKSGHPGGSLSIADVMAYLYFEEMNVDPQNPKKDDRDRFVLSKGHCAPALYATLANRGFFPTEELTTQEITTEQVTTQPETEPETEVTAGRDQFDKDDPNNPYYNLIAVGTSMDGMTTCYDGRYDFGYTVCVTDDGEEFSCIQDAIDYRLHQRLPVSQYPTGWLLLSPCLQLAQRRFCLRSRCHLRRLHHHERRGGLCLLFRLVRAGRVLQSGRYLRLGACRA